MVNTRRHSLQVPNLPPHHATGALGAVIAGSVSSTLPINMNAGSGTATAALRLRSHPRVRAQQLCPRLQRRQRCSPKTHRTLAIAAAGHSLTPFQHQRHRMCCRFLPAHRKRIRRCQQQHRRMSLSWSQIVALQVSGRPMATHRWATTTSRLPRPQRGLS
jgi:hypothetical protein